MQPEISVIIPVYNGAGFVSKAIDSVIGQEYPAHEILLVDDSSTDATPLVLDDYGDRIVRIRIPHAGVSAARNAGLRRASGDYVAFLDHDDVWFKTRLKKQAEAILKYPAIGFFCCDHIVSDSHAAGGDLAHFSRLRNKKQINFDAPLAGDPFGLLLREHFVGTASAVVLAKETADKVGEFNPADEISQDYDYWLRCARVTGFVVMSEALLYKRTHSQSLSADLVGAFNDHRTVLSRTIERDGDYLRKNRLWDTAHLELARTGYAIGNLWFEKGDKKEAFRIYARTLREHWAARSAALFLFTVFKKLCRIAFLDRVRRASKRPQRGGV
ncbi:MAG: glycosyltransferase [Candidatus Omnitrophica bacterium]|nr:glycosyltransferase [Candidatus Omnitrophota bacterium]